MLLDRAAILRIVSALRRYRAASESMLAARYNESAGTAAKGLGCEDQRFEDSEGIEGRHGSPVYQQTWHPSQVNWPAASFFALLVLPTTFLVWRGALPSHAFFVLLGAGLSWGARALGVRGEGATRATGHSPPPAGFSFPPEEIPTRPDASDAKRTQPMLAKTKKVLLKNLGQESGSGEDECD